MPGKHRVVDICCWGSFETVLMLGGRASSRGDARSASGHGLGRRPEKTARWSTTGALRGTACRDESDPTSRAPDRLVWAPTGPSARPARVSLAWRRCYWISATRTSLTICSRALHCCRHHVAGIAASPKRCANRAQPGSQRWAALAQRIQPSFPSHLESHPRAPLRESRSSRSLRELRRSTQQAGYGSLLEPSKPKAIPPAN